MDENLVQSLGFINRLKNRFRNINQRTAFDAFLILLIVVGLIATVFLAGQRQIFRSGASQNGSAEVVDENGQPIQTKDEDGNAVVETQQIYIKIDFPTDWNTQGFLPSVVKPAYGIHSIDHPLCGAKFPATSQGKDTICADSGGGLPGGLGKTCGAYVGGYDAQDCRRENYKYCFVYDPCPTTAPTSTPSPTQPPAQTATCIGAGYKCASPRDQTSALAEDGSICASYLGNNSYNTSCVARGTGYDWCYTSCAQPTAAPTRPPATQPTATPAQTQGCRTRWEGKRTECSADANRDAAGCTYLDAWSHPRSTVCSESTPFCWACPESAIETPQPTPTPTPTQPPAGGVQPPTPTSEPETTEWIRISLNKSNVENGNCFREPGGPGTGSSNPREHCMEFSITDPYFTQRGNMADLWLPPELETYTIYIGFVSTKGNYRPGQQVKVTYKPKAPPVAKATPTQPTGQKCISDVDPNGFARFCVNRENRDKLKDVCSGGELNVGYNCPSQYPYCLIGTNIICSPQAQPSPQSTAPQPTPPITTCNKLFEDCMKGDLEGTNKPYCDRIKYQCELPKTGGTAPTPTPKPIKLLEENPKDFKLLKDTLYVQNAKKYSIRLISWQLERGFGLPPAKDPANIDLTPGDNTYYSLSGICNNAATLAIDRWFSRKILVEYFDPEEDRSKTVSLAFTSICPGPGILTIR